MGEAERRGPRSCGVAVAPHHVAGRTFTKYGGAQPLRLASCSQRRGSRENDSDRVCKCLQPERARALHFWLKFSHPKGNCDAAPSIPTLRVHVVHAASAAATPGSAAAVCGRCNDGPLARGPQRSMHKDVDVLHPLKISERAQLSFRAMPILRARTRCRSKIVHAVPGSAFLGATWTRELT
jgi:hypothetical protein